MSLKKVNIFNFLKLSLVLSFVVGCSLGDRGQDFSFNDPEFLAKGQKQLGCVYPSSTPVDKSALEKGSYTKEDELDQLYEKYLEVSDEAEVRVDYVAWRSSPQDLGRLCIILEDMAEINLEFLTIEEQVSFLVNAYSVMMYDLVLSNYDKTASSDEFDLNREILNIDNKGLSVFSDFKWRIAGSLMSLNDIEFQYLAPRAGATAHFVLNRTTVDFISAPAVAARPENIGQLMDQAAQLFVNNRPHTRYLSGERIRTYKIIEDLEGVNAFSFDPAGRFESLIEFYAYFLDEAQQGFSKDDVLKRNFAFKGGTNWALNEKEQ